jgi:hypothetical protein
MYLLRQLQQGRSASYIGDVGDHGMWSFKSLSNSNVALKEEFPKGEKGETMNAISDVKVMGVRKESDSLGEVDVPSDKLWGAQNTTVA